MLKPHLSPILGAFLSWMDDKKTISWMPVEADASLDVPEAPAAVRSLLPPRSLNALSLLSPLIHRTFVSAVCDPVRLVSQSACFLSLSLPLSVGPVFFFSYFPSPQQVQDGQPDQLED